MTNSTVAADQLRLFIERIERLEEEKKGITEDISNVYSEAKANGYDTKIMRMVVRLRKMDTHTRQEQDAVLETYRAALNIDVPYSARVRQAPDKTPLEEAIDGAGVKATVTVNSGVDAIPGLGDALVSAAKEAGMEVVDNR